MRTVFTRHELRWVAGLALLVGAYLSACVFLGEASASTMTGTGIQMTAVDSATKTVDDQYRGNGGKTFAILLLTGGAFMFASGYHALGGLGALAGGGSAFIPATASQTFDAAPAATADVFQAMLHQWQVLLGFSVQRLWQEPIFLAVLLVTLCGVVLARQRREALR